MVIVSLEIGEGIGGFIVGFFIAFISVVIAQALPFQSISSSIPSVILLNVALGLILPLAFFISDIEDAVRAGFGYCLGLLTGGAYWLVYVSFSWYAIQMIVEAVFALVIGVLRRL